MEATQESTQPCTDPRRMGQNNSGLHEEDVSDIICILHPNSLAAHEAVAATARIAPQHILQRDEIEYETSDIAALDIALRLSSNVLDLGLGFAFGRNKSRCDLLLAPDDNSKRISNTHFRIYITDDNIIMLEDLSTNGTVVDDCRLRKNQKENSRMLTNGSVIQVVRGNNISDEVRFVVRIPSREGFAMPYTENLVGYFERVQKHQTGAIQPKTRQAPPRPEWTVPNAYGMHWSGGSLYNVTGQVGKGAFATVYKLATKQHGIVYAAKELDKRKFMKNGILDQKVDNEMQIMKDLKHPNIVQFIDHHEHDRWIYIIMEFVPFGDLTTSLQNHGGKIPEDMVKIVARQLLHALQYLHKRKITHRDIKPDNILIASLDPLRVKLSDFGLSKVVQEETFLKTFCGTLLYCAPEVYPDHETYRRGEIKKRRRLGDPPLKKSPYDQSVDMWSLGAVLYHILAGVAPYMGRGDDRGAQMLRTIMTTEPDFDVLRRAGISEAGVDFVARLLNRDPHSRPTERACFQHPWICDVEDVDEYDDDAVPFNGSDGLSDVDEELEEELDASQLSLDDILETEDVSEEENDLALSKRPRIDYAPAEIHYPSLPNIQSFQDNQPTSVSTPKRLFGEITPSALRSSNVLGASMDPFEGDDLSVHDFVSSAGESMISHGNSLNSVLSLPEHPFAGSAASLMGAENLVGQLNMNSWHPGTSSKIPAIVETPGLETSVNEAVEDNKGSELNQQPRPKDATPKAAKFSRRIDLPIPDTSSEGSSRRTTRENTRDPYDNFEAAPGEVFDIELAITIDAKTGQQISDLPENTKDYQPDNTSITIPKPVSLSRHSKPRPLLGKLTTLPGSIFDLTIDLENRMTSWGRGPQATICHPDPMDTRIPAYALEVTFWTPAIESQIAAGRDWMTVPGVMAILSTKTRKCIWVNDAELRRGPEGDNGKEGFHFGKLYTGDIITVFKHRNKFLKFRCEFYHGDSARTRPDEERGFTVRKVLMSKDSLAANRLPARKGNDGKK